MKTIYVVGSINTDLVIGAPYMPASGETLTGGGKRQRRERKRFVWLEMYVQPRRET